jgi:hypothetical protein
MRFKYYGYNQYNHIYKDYLKFNDKDNKKLIDNNKYI